MPITLKVMVNPPFKKIREKHKAAHKKTLDRQREQVRQLGRDWVMLTRDEAPERSGKFKKSIIYRTFDKSEGVIIMRGYYAKPLGDWIRKGTRPHVIRAKNKKALKFLWPNGPRSSSTFTAFHFYRSVNHPGTKANDFVGRAMIKWRPRAIVAVRKITRQYVISLTGE